MLPSPCDIQIFTSRALFVKIAWVQNESSCSLPFHSVITFSFLYSSPSSFLWGLLSPLRYISPFWEGTSSQQPYFTDFSPRNGYRRNSNRTALHVQIPIWTAFCVAQDHRTWGNLVCSETFKSIFLVEGANKIKYKTLGIHRGRMQKSGLKKRPRKDPGGIPYKKDGDARRKFWLKKP